MDSNVGKPTKTGREGPVRSLVRELVDVCGYRLEQIQTGSAIPLEHAKSDSTRTGPDIAVFDGALFHLRGLRLLVTCAPITRAQANAVLRDWLESFPSLPMAAWSFQGERLILARHRNAERGVNGWIEIPRLPGPHEEIPLDAAPLRRRDLVRPTTLIGEFASVRNYLAGNASGITRDSMIARETTLLLLCKVFEEVHSSHADVMSFQCLPAEKPEGLRKRIEDLELKIRSGWPGILAQHDSVHLDDESLAYIVRTLQRFEISGADRDVLGEAFEAFIGPTLRGEEGQFFTPRNLVRLAVKMINPKPGERFIDPACGSGGFLTVAFDHVHRKASETGHQTSTVRSLSGDRPGPNSLQFVGIDKDEFLAWMARAYLAIVGTGSGQVFCQNSLAVPDSWSSEARETANFGTFDVVATNPPFGARIPVAGPSTLSQYQLGYEWRTGKSTGLDGYTKTGRLKDSEAPQILFIERCLELLNEGGRMAIVLPEGVLGNASLGYVRQFVRERAEIVAIVDCPLETFLPSNSTKVALVVLQKRARPRQGSVFMAIAEKCGHDRRGKTIFREDGTPDDDFPRIAEAFMKFRRKHHVSF